MNAFYLNFNGNFLKNKNKKLTKLNLSLLWETKWQKDIYEIQTLDQISNFIGIQTTNENENP